MLQTVLVAKIIATNMMATKMDVLLRLKITMDLKYNANGTVILIIAMSATVTPPMEQIAVSDLGKILFER